METADKLHYISSEYNLSCCVQEPVTSCVVTDASQKIYFRCNYDSWTFTDRGSCFWNDERVITIPSVSLDDPAPR